DREEDIQLLFRKFANDFADRYKTSTVQLSEEAKDVLIQYSWPGNVRELKNIAEQISVLSKDKMISADQLRSFLPTENHNRLPVLSDMSLHESQYEFNNEREILKKLFFKKKKDVNELKKMFFDLLQNPKIASHSSLLSNTDSPVTDVAPKNYIPAGNSSTP